MRICKMILKIGERHASGWLSELYGEAFMKNFNHVAQGYLRIILENMHNPEKTIYSVNFAFAPAYISWYRSAKLLKRDDRETEEILWKMTDEIANHFPSFLFRYFTAYYLWSTRKGGLQYKKLCDEGKTGSYDFIIDYKDADAGGFNITVKKCAIMTLAEEFEAPGVFPFICRAGFKLANHVGINSSLDAAIGEGDECCQYRYIMKKSR